MRNGVRPQHGVSRLFGGTQCWDWFYGTQLDWFIGSFMGVSFLEATPFFGGFKGKPHGTPLRPFLGSKSSRFPGVSMTFRMVHGPFTLDNNPIFQGSWRLQVRLDPPKMASVFPQHPTKQGFSQKNKNKQTPFWGCCGRGSLDIREATVDQLTGSFP